MIVILKKTKTHVSHLTRWAAQKTTGAEKIRQIFTHLSLHMHEPDVKSHNGTIKALGHVGHVREEFQMRHGKIVR